MRKSTARLVKAIEDAIYGFKGSEEYVGPLKDILNEAKQDAFHDYFGKYDIPEQELHSRFLSAGFTELARMVTTGCFDADKEEAEEWAQSPEGIRSMMDDNAIKMANQLISMMDTVEGQQELNRLKSKYGIPVNPLFREN